MSRLTYFLVLLGVVALAATTATDASRNLLDKKNPSELSMPRPRLDAEHPLGLGHPDRHALEEGLNDEREQRLEPEKKQPPFERPPGEHDHDHDGDHHNHSLHSKGTHDNNAERLLQYFVVN